MLTKAKNMKLFLTVLVAILATTVFGQGIQAPNPTDFVPRGFVLFEKIFGDLNKDGIDDCVLIIKGTDPNKIIIDEAGNRLDQNRRGVVLLFNRAGYYEEVIKNYDCFASENEDGGVYYPPEMSIEISKGKIFVNYEHGRYGYWKYTFRYQNNDFEMIGYDESVGTNGIVESETSINFLTKKKLEKININKRALGGDEVFKEKWKPVSISSLLKLSEIDDFDTLEMSRY